MNKARKFGLWLLTVVCFAGAAVYGLQLCSLLMLVTGLLIMPVPFTEQIWHKCGLKHSMKTALATVLFFFGFWLAGTSIPKQDAVTAVKKSVTATVAIRSTPVPTVAPVEVKENSKIDSMKIPSYFGAKFVKINQNIPCFEDTELSDESFTAYSELDSFGRAGTVYASISKDTIENEVISASDSAVTPSGWQDTSYDSLNGNSLYTRCNLVSASLTGDAENSSNMITGTNYLNEKGIQPFEEQIKQYVNETGNHVLYRVTPIYQDDNLVADGVLLEAESVEDKGEGIKFNVFCYNVQPGIDIDYSNGNSTIHVEPVKPTPTSKPVSTPVPTPQPTATPEVVAEPAAPAAITSSVNDYILNTNTHKFHYTWCSSVKQMKDKNKQYYSGTRDEVISWGYDPCKRCNP